MKKRSTTIGPNQDKQKKINLIATRNLKNNKRKDDFSGRKSKAGSQDGDGENDSRRAGEGDGKDTDLVTDEKVVHKKKLKKNVESKDAWT